MKGFNNAHLETVVGLRLLLTGFEFPSTRVYVKDVFDSLFEEEKAMDFKQMLDTLPPPSETVPDESDIKSIMSTLAETRSEALWKSLVTLAWNLLTEVGASVGDKNTFEDFSRHQTVKDFIESSIKQRAIRDIEGSESGGVVAISLNAKDVKKKFQYASQCMEDGSWWRDKMYDTFTILEETQAKPAPTDDWADLISFNESDVIH